MAEGISNDVNLDHNISYQIVYYIGSKFEFNTELQLQASTINNIKNCNIDE